MAWYATRPFTLKGVRYGAGDHIPVTIPTDIQQSLLTYRRITEGPEPKGSDAGNQRSDAPRDEPPGLKPLGYGWYEGPDGKKIHGKKAALAALEA